MKIRKNPALKILAFLLAAAAFTSAALMGWYQLVNFDAIWEPDGDIASGRSIRQMNAQDTTEIHQLLCYRRRVENGEELSLYSQQHMKELESALDGANTNLRWQGLDANGQWVYGNTEGDFPADSSLYYTDITLQAHDATTITQEHGEWQAWAEGVYTAEDTPSQIRTEEWQTELAEAVEAYRNETPHPDMDAVYMGIDGSTEMLLVEQSGQVYLYGPTIRSVVETNEMGFRYVIGEGWVEFQSPDYEQMTLVLWVDESLPVNDAYKTVWQSLESWTVNRGPLLAITIGLAVLGLLLTVYLCAAAGHKKGSEGIYLNWFHRIPGDLLLAAAAAAVTLLCIALYSAATQFYYYYDDVPMVLELTLLGGLVCAIAVVVMGSLITFCARAKAHTLLRHTAIWMLFGWLRQKCSAISAAIPLIWKVVLAGAVYLVVNFFLLRSAWYCYRPIGRFSVWVGLTAVVIAYLCWWAWQWRQICDATEDIIDGFTDRHIDTSKMPPDLKAHANELNHLSEAISAAVDDQLRSEHFKAELITNVSHDLKTPLTSIINYVDLLKKEDIDNPKAVEYIEVLDRKSQRLKKLTEDLVEASKASTGNLTVVRERLDLVQLVDQALAEYQDRLESQRLSIVRTLPAEPVWVEADGRHLWRVIDNLLSNCAKYALEGTRIYAEVEKFFDCAELSIKNISRDALNVDPSALMERFVRGDESRTMEGSGLGLSIAQSLTDLQKGHFFVSIDGDLFKATVRLPLADQ